MAKRRARQIKEVTKAKTLVDKKQSKQIGFLNKVLFKGTDNYLDFGVAGFDVDYTGAVYPLASLVQGDAFGQRQGNAISAILLQLRWRAVVDVPTGFNLCRVIIFRDIANSGVLPTTAQILSTVGTPFSTMVQRKKELTHRFKVLYDKTIDLNVNGRGLAQLSKTFKLNALDMVYDGNAGTVADYRSNQLFLMVISDDAVAGNGPNVSFNTRITYVQ